MECPNFKCWNNNWILALLKIKYMRYGANPKYSSTAYCIRKCLTHTQFTCNKGRKFVICYNLRTKGLEDIMLNDIYQVQKGKFYVICC